jgi:hypothetical protein
MSWVEELKPEDDVEVEIIYPQTYIDYNMSTIRKYSAAISNICKGYAQSGEDYAEFHLYGMTIVQVISIEIIMKQFGIELAHEHKVLFDGERCTHFYADLRGLRKRMDEDGEFDFEEE